MLRYHGNTTPIDFKIFDEDENARAKRTKKHNARIEANKDPNDTASRRGNSIVLIVFAGLALLALYFYIRGDIERNDLNSEIAAAEARIAESSRENTRLRAELSAMATPSRVEEYAAANGLVRDHVQQVTHISISVENVVEIAEEPRLDFYGRLHVRIEEILAFLGLA
jgi:cell division protein FtsL